jgi:hypothetical protein
LSIVGGEAEVLVVQSNFGVGNGIIVQALMAHLILEWVNNAQRRSCRLLNITSYRSSAGHLFGMFARVTLLRPRV